MSMIGSKEWDELVRQSIFDGVTAGALTAVGTGSIVAYLHKYNATFQKSVGIKAATVFIPAAFAFWLRTQMTIVGARGDHVHPPASKARSILPVYENLPIHQWAMNWVAENPFKFIGTVGGAGVVAIFTAENILHAEQKLSSRVMHTRVYGQGFAVTLLCGTMIFQKYMRTHGKFVPEGHDEPQAQLTPATTRRPTRWDLMLPLVYAPVLPLIRIGMRGRFPQRTIDRVFIGTLLLALTHAGYVMFKDSSI
eukprot:c22255_g1_i1.p1 GENE.c22255_g1_i1~~c22255_g1_i1.p1  ORF type:complete len:251 (+),score=38.19 c22255_g1_i1:75-827(+)